MNKILILFIFISTTAVSQMAVNSPLESSGGVGGQFCDGLLLLNQIPNQLNAKASDLDCDACGSVNPVQVAADNFRITSDGFISELTLFIAYLSSDTPLDNDEWTVNIHTDSMNKPGFVLYSEVDVVSTRTASGVTLFGADEYRIVLTLESPVALDVGFYWIEIHNNSVESTDTVFWGTGSPHANSRNGTVFSKDYPAVTWLADDTNYLSLQLCDVVSDTIYFDGFDAVIIN